MISPDMEHRVSQLRHDVDDVYELLDVTNKTVKATSKDVSSIAMTQRRHGNRLEEIQTALDLTVGRLDRLEQSHSRLEENQNRMAEAVGNLAEAVGSLAEGHRSLAEGHRSLAEAQREQKGTLDAILAAVRGQPTETVSSTAAITDGDDHR